jgi:hypothetical protein
MARYCDLCVIMKKGQLVAVGNPKEVITEDLVRDVYDVIANVGVDKDGEIYVLPKKFAGDYRLRRLRNCTAPLRFDGSRGHAGVAPSMLYYVLD